MAKPVQWIFLTKVGATTTYEKFEPQAFIEEGDKVIALGVAHFTTTTTSKKGVSPWIMAWTFKKGECCTCKKSLGHLCHCRNVYVIA